MAAVLTNLQPIWGLIWLNCIFDDEACREASYQEIIRRYYYALNRLAKDEGSNEEVYKIELLMKQAKISTHSRQVVSSALTKAEVTGAPAAALQLPDGTIITGKTTDLLTFPQLSC